MKGEKKERKVTYGADKTMMVRRVSVSKANIKTNHHFIFGAQIMDIYGFIRYKT